MYEQRKEKCLFEADTLSFEEALSGGKGAFNGKLARWIISLMPPRDGSWNRYVEPYFGGGSVMMNLDPEGLSEYANDLDGELMNFWRVLQTNSEGLLRFLAVTPVSASMFEGASTLHNAAAFFIRNRQSRQGLGKDYITPTSRTRRGMNEHVSAWLSAVEGLAEVVERMQRVEVWNRPAIEVIQNLDSFKTVFYLDPPYLHETRTSTGEYGGFEMTFEDHRALLITLSNIRGRFLLSGYRSELYDTYACHYGWHRHDHDIVNNASSGLVKKTMTECIWTNYS